MKNNVFKHIFLLPIMLFLLSAVLVSCSDDAGEESDDRTPVTLQLDISTRASGDEVGIEIGEDNEFIHSLWVFVVDADNNKVVWKYEGEIDSEAKARYFLSEPIEDKVAPGRYDVYAFANIENVTVSDDSFLDIGEGETFPELDNITVEDPAATVNLATGNYIPMSGINANFQVTEATRIIPVQLDRLVSKVRMTISDLPEQVNKNTTVVFSGYSENVPLMVSSSASHGESNLSKEIHLSEEEPTNNDYQLSFYVNETPAGEGFTVTLNTGSETGVVAYTAQTELKALPRNRVYPLTLTFEDADITLTPTAYIQVTGLPAYEVTYDVDYDTDSYTFGIAYGSYLTIVPSVESADGTSPQFTWSEAEGNPDGMAEVQNAEEVGLPQLTGESLLRMFTADNGISDEEYKFMLNVVWTSADSGYNYNRTYNVIIKITQDYDTVLDGIIDNLNLSSALRTSNAVIRLSPERLNMVKVK